MLGHADIITYAKFQDDIFRGYDFTGGRISHFPIDFCMDLTTVQRDCAACDIGREMCERHAQSVVSEWIEWFTQNENQKRQNV